MERRGLTQGTAAGGARQGLAYSTTRHPGVVTYIRDTDSTALPVSAA